MPIIMYNYILYRVHTIHYNGRNRVFKITTPNSERKKLKDFSNHTCQFFLKNKSLPNINILCRMIQVKSNLQS